MDNLTQPCPSAITTSEIHPFPDPLTLLRTHYLRIALISLVLLVPCFWQKHIIACDLPSHTYNAWLATLIERGQAPSLYIAPQWNNILFDIILTRLCQVFGFGLGEKLAVSLSVLLFFWGSFALAAAASQRAPWFVVPLLMMVTYGWTFYIGFSNYYLSLALAFWGIAFFWHAPLRYLLFAIPFGALTYLAHPLGVACFFGTVAYIRLLKMFSGWWKLVPPILAIALLIAARVYLQNHYQVAFSAPLYLVNGIDQLILGVRFRLFAKILLYFGVACFLLDIFLSRKEVSLWRRLVPPASLYAIALAAVLLLPDVVYLPQYAIPFEFTTMRLTLGCAVFAICVLAIMAPRLWHTIAFSLAAVVFFSLVWQETRQISTLEAQAEQFVAQIPPNQRVIATLRTFRGSRFYFLNHLVDRACIEKCFSYSNYEPSSGQFRVRVLTGSPIVGSSPVAVDRMQSGEYVVKASDLPLYEINQCTSDLSKLCMRELLEGETNGRAASPPK